MRRWLAREALWLAAWRGVAVCLAAAGAVACALFPAPLRAQVVRGTVRDLASGAPIAGVVVTLHRAGAVANDVSRVAATLTNASGAYALTASDTGTFVVTAKRIGVRQFQSEALTLRAGEARQLDIALEAVRFDLPVVTVTGATLCDVRSGDRARIAALWEEARTALTASDLSLRERRFRATITRYHRTLEPRSLRIRHETNSVRQGVTERAFSSIAPESLAANGYARLLPDGVLDFYAPDDRVLLSDGFVRDHCFSLERTRQDGEVGIAFTPTKARKTADIAGVIWLDARSYELRRVTFRYTNFPLPVTDARVGGEVHFERLARGAWYVSRWFMRVPRIELPRSSVTTLRAGRVADDRARIVAFIEDGGLTSADEGGGARTAILTGQAVDSARRPLVGARVSLAGLDKSVMVAADGSFRLAEVLAGNYTLVVEHPDYARLGLVAGEQVLTIEEGKNSSTIVMALRTAQILRQLCGYDEDDEQHISMRLIPPAAPVDSAHPRVLRVTRPVRRLIAGNTFRTETESVELPVDALGAVNACGLPALERVVVEERAPDGALVRRWELRTPERGVSVVELRE
ncbi:MAG: carboxypeptidase regulatory-like domain-containing protein [Gemmatimonadaceae bacterium]|nr:carboxypeptidase regulatory-like domain-containing protein [Gemmatimonadaceae bacterium]